VRGSRDPAGRRVRDQAARTMIERAIGSGLPFGRFTADEAYGDNGALRDWLQERNVSYVAAVACDHRAPAGAGQTIRADALAAKVPDRGWHRMSCGPGSKGERLYDRALAPARDGRQLLLHLQRGAGLLPVLVPAHRDPRRAGAGRRGPVGGRGELPGRQERDRARSLPGPQARRLVPARHPGHVRARLAGRHRCRRRDRNRPAASPVKRGPAGCGQLPRPETAGRNCPVADSHSQPPSRLTVNEIRRMHAILCRPAHPPAHHVRWSGWRRRHQQRARRCHYQRRRERARL
jgi:DDE superfamily endonuclease